MTFMLRMCIFAGTMTKICRNACEENARQDPKMRRQTNLRVFINCFALCIYPRAVLRAVTRACCGHLADSAYIFAFILGACVLPFCSRYVHCARKIQHPLFFIVQLQPSSVCTYCVLCLHVCGTCVQTLQ